MGSLREAARDRDWRGGLGLAHSRLGSVQIASYDLSKFAAPFTRPIALYARARRAATGRAACELWGLCARPPAIEIGEGGLRIYLFYHPYTRARALLARPWSAGCYGVARQREGSRQNSIGGSGVLSLRHFGLVLFIPWRVGAEENLARRRRLGPPGFRFMVSAGAMLLDRLGPPGFRFRFIDFRAPAFPFYISYTARARGRCWPGRGLPVATG